MNLGDDRMPGLGRKEKISKEYDNKQSHMQGKNQETQDI